MRELTLCPQLSGVRLLDPFNQVQEPMNEDYPEDFRTVWNEVKDLEEEKKTKVEAGIWTRLEAAKMKRIWPHARLDGVFGTIYEGENHNMSMFNEGRDHEAWLILCGILEKMGGWCRVVDVGEGENEGWKRNSSERKLRGSSARFHIQEL